MNEPRTHGVDKPTPEQLVGRQVRFLRQTRRWSQQDVAEKMQAYGYRWSQATVTRLEAATRPIRLNEVADLATLFGIPAAHFLEFWSPEFGSDDLEALQTEIASLDEESSNLQVELNVAREARDAAYVHETMLGAELARVEGRLAILRKWLPQTPARPSRPTDDGDVK